MADQKTHIFFHMGPGFHAQIERTLFEGKYPHVLFVDQPYNLSYSELCSWAERLIEEQFKKTNCQLTLLGHSFGAQVVAGAMKGISNLVNEVRILNSPYQSLDAFISLEAELFPDSAQGKDYWHSKTVDEKMLLIFKVGSDLKLNSFYWRCDKSRSVFEGIAASQPTLNVSSFLKVYMDYLSSPTQDFIWQGSTKILFSKQDALIADPAMVENWKSVFPNAVITAYEEGGHYLHIENAQVAELFWK